MISCIPNHWPTDPDMAQDVTEIDQLRRGCEQHWPGRVGSVSKLRPELAMSDRRYYVIDLEGGRTPSPRRVIAAISPIAKARAFVQVRELFASHGVPTPDIYGFDEWKNDAVVFQEHLGDGLLIKLNDKTVHLAAIAQIAMCIARIPLPKWATGEDLSRRYDGAYIRSRLETLVVPAFTTALRRPLSITERDVLKKGLDLLSRVHYLRHDSS